MENMDVFSLEEDDYGDMFITQSSSNSSQVESSGNKVEILGDGADFVRPMCSLVSNVEDKSCKYSDISEDEDFEIPSPKWI